jgi:hypothetical protein
LQDISGTAEDSHGSQQTEKTLMPLHSSKHLPTKQITFLKCLISPSVKVAIRLFLALGF